MPAGIQEHELIWYDTTLDEEGIAEGIADEFPVSFKLRLMDIPEYDVAIGFYYGITKRDVENSAELSSMDVIPDKYPFFSFHPYITRGITGFWLVDKITWTDHESNSGKIDEGYKTDNYDMLVEYLYQQAMEIYRGVDHETLFVYE